MKAFANYKLKLHGIIGAFAASLLVIAGWNVFFFVCPGFGQEYLPSPAQLIAMPGAGKIECKRAGLYRVYFVERKPRDRKMARNSFVRELERGDLSLYSVVSCRIVDCVTREQIPCNYSGNSGSYSSSDMGSVLGFATFMAPHAGLYEVVSSTSQKTLGNCYLEVLPQDWDEIGPMIQSCAAHLILKGSILKASDITRERPFTKGPILGPNNLVQDEREVIGCRTKRTLWPGNYIRYSDVDFDWSKLRQE